MGVLGAFWLETASLEADGGAISGAGGVWYGSNSHLCS